jgi:aminopeptidase N
MVADNTTLDSLAHKAWCWVYLQIGLVGPDGQDMPLHLKPAGSGKQKGRHKSSSTTKPVTSPEGVILNTGLQGRVSTSVVLLVDSWSQSFTFTSLPNKPYLSLLRDFSAPVRLDVDGETDKSLGFLAMHDSNPFAR